VQDVLPALRVGPAGRKLQDAIVATPKVPGFVFTGSVADLRPGYYELRLTFDRGSFVNALTDRSGHAYPSGLVLEVRHGGTSIGCRPLALDELARGTIAVAFRIPRGRGDERMPTEFRLFSIGQVGFAVSGASLTEAPDDGTADDVGTFNYVPMLSVGPAGVRGPGPRGGRVIRAQRELAGFVAHGPYVWFPPGTYRVCFDFDLDSGEAQLAVKTEVVTDLGDRVLAEETIEMPRQRNRLASLFGLGSGPLERCLRFVVSSEAPQSKDGLLEFRVWSPGATGFSLGAVRVARLGGP
jgi:hypothetical protein